MSEKENQADVYAHASSVIERMFIATADQNYVLARWAFFNDLTLDFFWLTAHAVEKYLKAILLYNGKSAKNYSHDIEKLYEDVLTLESRPYFPDLKKPIFLEKTDFHWIEQNNESFIKRLANMGSPHNRYMTYGYTLREDDLFKVDQIVWALRRYCRPPKLKIDLKETKEFNWYNVLRNDQKLWNLNSWFLIERTAQEISTEKYKALFYLNTAFNPEGNHELSQCKISGHNSPFLEWFHLMQADGASPETKRIYTQCFNWALENLSLSPHDRKEIEQALSLKTKL